MEALFECDEPAHREGNGPMAERTRQWLGEMGLSECDDPNAMILLEAAMDLDELNSGVQRLTYKDLVNARGKVRHTITTARRSLQSVIDEHATQRLDERHRMHYGRVVARTLGWIDPEMLSAETLAKVGAELLEEHGIELADYSGERAAP